MQYNFKAKIWIWQADSKGSWFFVTLPKGISAEIKEITASGLRRGFGSVKVEATIGSSTWRTSIFPNAQDKTYILPIKKSIRQSEKIVDSSHVDVNMKLVEI